MFLFISGLLYSLFLIFFFYSNYFFLPNRYSVLIKLFFSFIKDLLNIFFHPVLFVTLFLFLSFFNLLGNIPLCPIPTIYYRFSITLRLIFWISIIICVMFSQLVHFISHMMPYGSPMFLRFFLPLVEIFSQVIRPLTLIIRLRTNLSSGHIIIFIFSYFSSLSSILSPFIFLVLRLLLVLEFCISLLQAYIFVSLLVLYINETL